MGLLRTRYAAIAPCAVHAHVQRAETRQKCSCTIRDARLRPAILTDWFACARRFDTFRPLHALWSQYIEGLRAGSRSLEELMLVADLHGSYLRIAACKEARRVGLCGIVIKDSGQLVHIITADNRVFPIMKRGSVFETGLDPDTIVQLNGDKLSDVWIK